MGVLNELHKSSIRVSDIAAQYWCERQMELNYIHGPKITKEIKKGKTIHEELENETNVPVILMPKSYPDFLYKSLYTSYMALTALQANKKTREVQIYGSLGGYKVVGKIDQIDIKNNATILTEDKTRSKDDMPSEAQALTHKVQLMVYRKLFEDIKLGNYTADNFIRAYRTADMKLTDEFLRQLDALKVEKKLQSVDAIARRFFGIIPLLSRISDTLHIRYINQFTGNEIKLYKFQYDKLEMQEIITYVLKYWNGERKSMPVPEEEQWKCKWCAFFGNECKVWWPQTVLK